MTTLKHYFKRIFTHPLNLLILIGLPIGILIINILVMQAFQADIGVEIEGYDIPATVLMVVITIMFAFFNMSLAYDFPFDDFRTARRWRLLAAPVSLTQYLLSNAFVGFVFSMLTSAILVAVGVLFFNAYLPNVFVLAAVVFVFSIFSQLVGILLYLLCPKKANAEALVFAIVFGLFILSGQFMFPVDLGSVGNFIFGRSTPNALAVNREHELARKNEQAKDYGKYKCFRIGFLGA